MRDIGCAYLMAGLGLIWRAWRPSQGAPAALIGAGFLLLHAGVHLWELAVGLCGWGQFLRDLPGVGLAAGAALALAWPPKSNTHQSLGGQGSPAAGGFNHA
ncbi:hypothetical protein WG899_14160 [Paucibacter sp. AS339]|uniref:hypothetical protein n=1 Tax=Paucibacter hankyongi TaxID=3133434 RepID=UPI0030A63D1A